MPTERSNVFCQKHLNEWDEHGVKMANQFIPPDCIANNNAAEKQLDRPYFDALKKEVFKQRALLLFKEL